jgi:hypothetical protein
MKINRNNKIYNIAEYVVRLEKALGTANSILNKEGKLGVLPTETSVSFRNGNTFHKNVRSVLNKFNLLNDVTVKEEVIKKCVIARYDDSIKEPPFKTIIIDDIEVLMPENDGGGEEFAHRLIAACKDKGYSFRFYCSSSEKDVDFEIVVD